jgi:hypothetical protein
MIKITDYIDLIRHKIDYYFKDSLSKDDIDYDKILEKVDEIKKNNNFYRLFVSILFLDDYRIKFRYVVNNCETEDDKETLSYYDNNISNVDDIITYFEESGDFLEMINSTILFSRLDSNRQREVIKSCKMRNQYLSSVSPIHTLDLLYYGFPISLDNYIELFNEYNGDQNSLDASSEATVEFSQQLTDLYISDTDNYSYLIDKLIETYKIMSFNKIFDDEELNGLVKKDVVDIYNIIYRDSHLRIKLLNHFLEYNIACTKEEMDNFKEEFDKVKKKR